MTGLNLICTLGELAERIGADVEGDRGRRIAGIRTLADAGPEHLSFLTSAKFLDAARSSGAGALLVGRGAAIPGRDLLVAVYPQLALAGLLAIFHPRRPVEPGVHPTAVVGRGSRIDPSAAIAPYAVIGDDVEIGAGAFVGPHAVVGDGCRVGERTVLHAHVVLYAGVRLGAGVEIHAGTVLGADGFGYATVKGVHHKIPQVGTVAIGDDVEIGALTAIDRALLGATTIGAGTKIDNLVQVGHNVEVGERSVLCGQVGIAGSAKLGAGVVLGGRAGVADHQELGDGVQVAATSVVMEKVPAGSAMAGVPALPLAVWRRQQAVSRRLPELWRRLKAIERRLGLGGIGGDRTGAGTGGDEGSDG